MAATTLSSAGRKPLTSCCSTARRTVSSSRWEQILASAEATSAWAQVAADVGIGFSLYAHSPIAYWPPAYLALTPQQARQLYDRLARLGMIDFPRQSPVRDISGPGRRGIHNRLPELIAQHLTDAAARELQAPGHGAPRTPRPARPGRRPRPRLSENLPPLTLAQFSTLTSDVNRRIVRDIAELTQVVLEALDTLQEQALRSHGWSMLMWNRIDEKATGGWWPTWEDNLSNLVCAFLREHLAEQKPVINREVEIQPRNLDGGRTDIHVQATDPRDAAIPAPHRDHRGQRLLEPRNHHRHQPAAPPLPAAPARLGRDLPRRLLPPDR